MPCDTALKAGQTISQRAEEVRKAVKTVDALIAARRVQVRVGPQGAITFVGITTEQRDGMTDGCIYRMLSRTGSVGARMAIAKAEQMAGRTVDRKVIAQGVHSHDGGNHWHGRG